MFERSDPRKSKATTIGEWGRGGIAEAVLLGGPRVWGVTAEETGFMWEHQQTLCSSRWEGSVHMRAVAAGRYGRCSDSVDIRVSLSRKCWRGKNVLCRKVREYVNWGSVV